MACAVFDLCAIQPAQQEAAACTPAPYEAFLPLVEHLVVKPEPLHIPGRLVGFAYAALEDGRLVGLAVVVAHRPYQVHLPAGFCRRMSRYAPCIVQMALGHVVLFPPVLGDIPLGFPDRDAVFCPEPLHQRFTHNAHERGVAVRLLPPDVRKVDPPRMQKRMAMHTQRYQVVGRVPARLPALDVVYVQLDGLLRRGMRSAATAGVAVPVQDVLPCVVCVVHLSELVVRTHRQRLPFLHRLEPLEVELRCLHHDGCYGQQAAYPPDGGDMLPDLYLYRGRKPALVLAVYPVLESSFPIPGVAVSPRSAVCPAVGHESHHIIPGCAFRSEQLFLLCGRAQADGLAASVYAQRHRLPVPAAAIQ